MDAKWFSHDPAGNGFEFHDSMEKAQDAAMSSYDAETSNDGGCADDIREICWGLVFVSFDEDGPKNDVDDLDNGYALAGQFAAEADSLRARIAASESRLAELEELNRIVSHPGFFQLQKGSRAVSTSHSVTSWSVGVSTSEEARVDWWHGDTLEDAIHDCHAALDLARKGDG